MSSLIPPKTPYFSLADSHAQNYFTKERIKQHLLRAGLINRNGCIITEAEYQSRQTDIAIGRQNRLKLDEAILEVLTQMGEEQYKLFRQDMETNKKNLQHQFRRIEKKYARRVHPINIRITHDGQVVPEPDDSPTRSSSHSSLPPINATHSPKRPLTALPLNELDAIRRKIDEFDQKLNTRTRNNTSHALLWNIQHLVNQLKDKQDEAEKQQETWQKKYNEEEEKRTREIERRFQLLYQQVMASAIGNQQIIELIGTSTVVKDLRESISAIYKLLGAIPVALTQADIDTAIVTRERKTVEREGAIEKLAHDARDKLQQLEIRFAELSAELTALPIPITRTDVEELIRNAMQNLKPIEQNDTVLEKLAREVNDKVTQLEIRLNDLLKSTSVYVTRTAVEELIYQATLNKKSTLSALATSQLDARLEPRIAALEQRLNTLPQVPDLHLIEQRLGQLENRSLSSTVNDTNPDDRTLTAPLIGLAPRSPSTAPNTDTVYIQDPRIIMLQNQINDHASVLQTLDGQINEMEQAKVDRPTVDQMISASEWRTKEAIANLVKHAHRECQDHRVPEVLQQINDHLALIQNLSDQINSLHNTKADRQAVDDRVKAGEQRNELQIDGLRKSVNENEHEVKKVNRDLAALLRRFVQQPTPKPASPKSPRPHPGEDLQAIMPFSELLPTFDMLVKNEWD